MSGRSNDRSETPWLHVIATEEVMRRAGFVELARGVMIAMGPAGALHLRARELSGRALLALARALVPTGGAGCALLVVNERVDVALAAGAGAVQLPAWGMDARDAARVAPALRIGVSVHSVDEARAAREADWLLAGHVFATSSHAEVPPRGLTWLADVARASAAPVIAIGGVRPERARELRAAGAWGVAVVSGVWDDGDPIAAVARYLSAYADGA